jgi:hypothetical protein
MPAIYGSAALTIAAFDAENGNGGCNVNPKPVEFVDVDTESLRIRFFQHPPPHLHTMYGDDKYQHDGHGTMPLRTRAWTLQERFLSNRSVHYANGVMLWECKTTKVSSILPWGHHDPPDDFVPWPILESTNESRASEGPMVTRAAWFRIIEDYSGRFMTKEPDKLPALSGVANHFSSVFQNDDYHAGLFRRHFPAALLWRSIGNNYNPREITDTVRKYSAFWPRRPSEYRAPSWSWAGLDGAVSYDSQRLTNLGGPRPETGAPRQEKLLRLIDVQTRQKSSDPYGAVVSSHIRVLGRVAVVQLHWDRLVHSSFGRGDDDRKPLITVDGVAVGLVYPDIMNELQFVRDLVCLEVRDEPFWTETTVPETLYGNPATYDEAEKWERMDLVLALALLPVPGKIGVYQRRGLVRWLRRDVFKHAEQTEVTIV